MDELINLIKEGKFMRSNFLNKEDFLKQISYELFNEGYVTDKFYEGILKRELEFPTGLLTISLGVSLPHCESEYVIKNGIIIVVFENPIKFNRMDSPKETINVNLSFVLLIKDKDKHLQSLQQLISVFQSTCLEKIMESDSIDDVTKVLKEGFIS